MILKIVKFQLSLKPQFNFKINFSLEKHIQGFFDKISETISNYKVLKTDEKRRINRIRKNSKKQRKNNLINKKKKNRSKKPKKVNYQLKIKLYILKLKKFKKKA